MNCLFATEIVLQVGQAVEERRLRIHSQSQAAHLPRRQSRIRSGFLTVNNWHRKILRLLEILFAAPISNLISFFLLPFK